MTQEKVARHIIKVVGHYIDASLIERVVANFRKLLIDIDWIYGRRVDDSGIYELYLMVREHPNLYMALLNLSKTVGVEKVFEFNGEITEKSLVEDNKTFTIYIPRPRKVREYSWGVVNG
ncbi:hypothetical protein QPL79_03195 [Ignisphaera sp. 4213-co]|uniref:Uncharacterized protein n=1 Tax=Ignisphaera cupida TaxID=3050454 RepID=A0ABD4Z5X0_9CREN|nr:hypothetical protein [Ignisphaera sp. 4213-co]MDK6028367.1 hypothetical protein [Ignisphaera sp. 4213-co]